MQRRPPLKAQGNLSYLDFIRLLQYLWVNSHPDIDLVATTTREFPKYPIMTYRLDFRKAMDVEPKPRFREEVFTPDGQDAIIIHGQRFQSVVTFTCFSQNDPHLAEEIIEQFEDFMIEFTPVFKRMGVSELVYARRLPDTADTRPAAETVVERSVSYLLTTEKLITSSEGKLNTILIDARAFMQRAIWLDMATPSTDVSVIVDIVDTMGHATPPIGEFVDSDGIYIAEDN